MSIIKYLKKTPIALHVLEPDETLYERCYWLALFVKELKGKLTTAERHNEQLVRQVNCGEPLTASQQELLDLRHQVNELWRVNEKLQKRIFKLGQKAKHLEAGLEQRPPDSLAA